MRIIDAQDHDRLWMSKAVSLAQQAALLDEVPVGAVVVQDNHCIATGFNQPIALNDPCAHAEILALRQAAAHINNYRLIDATVYVTLEPCLMCAGALIHARVKRLVFGAFEPKAGAIVSQLQAFSLPHINHRPQVTTGVLQDVCSAQLSDFFQRKRAKNRQGMASIGYSDGEK